MGLWQFLSFFQCYLRKLYLNQGFKTDIMKKSIVKILLISGLFGAISMFSYSCKTGEGCPADIKFKEMEEKRKNGEVPEMSTKRGKSGLWSKKQKKKMKR